MKLALVLALALAGCGTDVDLGGSGGDGSVTQCGDLVAPVIEAGCRACSKDAADCQPNGCYGGYWCNVTATDCRQPPASCP